MPFPHSTSRQLTALSAALGDPSIDLESALRTLTSQFRGVVPEFLGLTVTVDISGVPVTLTTIDQCTVGSAQGCLLLALAPEAGFRAGDSVVLYAARPGAFSSLIARTGSSHPGLEGVYDLDRHLPLVADLPHPFGISGLQEVTTVNRAIGVLIDQGSTLREAQGEMRRPATA